MFIYWIMSNSKLILVFLAICLIVLIGIVAYMLKLLHDTKDNSKLARKIIIYLILLNSYTCGNSYIRHIQFNRRVII